MYQFQTIVVIAGFAVASLAKTSTFNPSTCARQSIAACPTPYDPCCAFVCAEAQVPFKVCSPENETVLAQCSKCPSPTSTTKHSTSTKLSTTKKPSGTSTPAKKTTTTKHTTTSSSKTTLTKSTCGPSIVTSGPACPTPYDPCCAWSCAEAQVPYAVCSQTDGTGEFATCSKCPSPTP